MTPREMGPRLKQIRAAKQLSQAALAQRAGLSREYVLRLEAGQQDPSLSTLTALAQALGVSLLTLLRAPGPRRPK